MYECKNNLILTFMLAVEEPEGALDVKVGTASGTPTPSM